MNRKKLPSQSLYSKFAGRVPGLTSCRGAMTLEAACAAPLFLITVITFLYLLEIMSLQIAVREGLQYAGRNAMQEAAEIPLLNPGKAEADIVESVGRSRLDGSILQGGSSGIDCSGSTLSPLTGIGKLQATYKVKIPIPLFHIPPILLTEHIKIKGWVGYEPAGGDMDGEEVVYVTETGLVYHKDPNCTHLDLSIRQVEKSQISGLRNESGGKYYACPICKKKGKACYITTTGDRYHRSLSCSGLKRTVYSIPVSEARGRRKCSRCGN